MQEKSARRSASGDPAESCGVREDTNAPDENRTVQQHLANERTLLAWVRTAIALIGLGFLTSGLAFKSGLFAVWEQRIAACVGLGSLLIALALIGWATRQYFRNRNGINRSAYRSATVTAAVLGIGMAAITLLLLILMGFVMVD